LQTSALFELPPTHDGAVHMVPAGCSWQEPTPLQKPVVPQLEADWRAHSLSGSVPKPMTPQAPSAPVPFLAVVQAWHVPLQEVLQQTPSVQNPD